MTYVVCQTSHCQQTYPIDSLYPITKETKNIYCEKCGGVLVDENGHANFSQHGHVIPVITAEEIEASNRERLQSKRKELAILQGEIQQLEEEEEEFNGDDIHPSDARRSDLPDLTVELKTGHFVSTTYQPLDTQRVHLNISFGGKLPVGPERNY